MHFTFQRAFTESVRTFPQNGFSRTPAETSQKQIRKLFDRHTNERLKYGKDVNDVEPFNCN